MIITKMEECGDIESVLKGWCVDCGGSLTEVHTSEEDVIRARCTSDDCKSFYTLRGLDGRRCAGCSKWLTDQRYATAIGEPVCESCHEDELEHAAKVDDTAHFDVTIERNDRRTTPEFGADTDMPIGDVARRVWNDQYPEKEAPHNLTLGLKINDRVFACLPDARLRDALSIGKSFTLAYIANRADVDEGDES